MSHIQVPASRSVGNPTWRLSVTVVTLLLLIIAFVCFLLAAFAHRAAAVTRVNLVAAGLAAWVLVPLLERLVALD